jgi:hypothetical protein
MSLSVGGTKATYAAGQKVYYKSASYAGAADVVSVHLDDDLVPYYTIRVEGKEKQTDDSHLSPVDGTPREQVERLLGNLSDAQLEHVAAFIRQLSGGSSAQPTAPSTPGKGPSAANGTTAGGGGIPSPTPTGPSPMRATQPAHPPQQQQQPAPPGQAQVRCGEGISLSKHFCSCAFDL